MPSLLGDYLPYTQGQSYIPTRRDLSVSGRNLAAMTAGFPGDIASFVPGSQTSLLGGLPTSDELVNRFGGDPQHISYWPAAVAAPGPGELKAAATGLLNLAPDAARAVADTGLLNYAMTLFHGTPHKFSKFELEKIGTGEGAQAYGHGLYFAESPGVAKSYQANLSRISPDPDESVPTLARYGDIEVDMKAPSKDLSTEQTAISHIVLNGDSPSKGLESLREWQTESVITAAERDKYRKAADWLEGIIDEGGDDYKRLFDIQKDYGHLYEVDIPDETIDKMLDWDAPLSEQPELQRVVSEVGGPITKRVLQERGGPNATAATFYASLSQDLGGQEAASAALREAGIPGIRFWDGNSRFKAGGSFDVSRVGDEWQVSVMPPQGSSHGGVSATKRFKTQDAAEAWGREQTEQGTRNIVVFNPDDIKSVKRDGELVYKAPQKKKGPFTDDVRDDWQLPGKSGPKTKARAKKMRKPPFSGR